MENMMKKIVRYSNEINAMMQRRISMTQKIGHPETRLTEGGA
jgi:hypothetical protein